jgi:hypothetical protein
MLKSKFALNDLGKRFNIETLFLSAEGCNEKYASVSVCASAT